MRILIVSPYYWPESYGAGVNITELAEGLAKLGHQVEVLTAFPNYPLGKIFPEYREKLFQVESHNGVRIVRIWVFAVARHRNRMLRGASTLSFALSALLASPAVIAPEVVLGMSPPPFAGWAGRIISRLYRAPFLLFVTDLFTDQIITSGLTQSAILIDILSRLEQTLYKKSSHIVVNANIFKNRLLSRGIIPDQLTVITDWADGAFIKPGPTNNDVRKEWSLEESFVVLYSGNMGHMSNLETILTAAVEVRDLPSIKFVLVGDGVKRPLLEKMASDMRLENVQFHPLQPRERFPQVLAAADVTLITLSKEAGGCSTQGKLYRLLAAGRPILGILPAGNDAWKIIREGQCGWCFEPEAVSGVVQLLRHLVDRKEQAQSYGKNARNLFDSRYSLISCVQQYDKIIGALAQH